MASVVGILPSDTYKNQVLISLLGMAYEATSDAIMMRTTLPRIPSIRLELLVGSVLAGGMTDNKQDS